MTAKYFLQIICFLNKLFSYRMYYEMTLKLTLKLIYNISCLKLSRLLKSDHPLSNIMEVLKCGGLYGQQTISYHTNSKLPCKQQVILTNSKLF